MSRTITISPMTRVSGLLSVEVLVEGNRVVDARASGGQFRGFEIMMRGRRVADAPYFTERVCGICSAAHGYAGALAADRAYDDEVPPNGWKLRNIILGAEILQNQIRHFYLLSLPDFVEMPPVPPFKDLAGRDYRLGTAATGRMVANYVRSVDASRKCHEIVAVLAGKAPHAHGMVPGGVSVQVTADRVLKCGALLEEIMSFLDDCYLPDVETLAGAYADYFQVGSRPPRFLSTGLFRVGPRMDTPATPAGVVYDGRLEPLDPLFIREYVGRSWFDESGPHPAPDPDKPFAYTWCTAPRYRGMAFEVGPLARQAVCAAHGLFQGPMAPRGAGTMDRLIARAVEARRIASLVQDMLRTLEPGAPTLSHKPSVTVEYASVTIEAPRGTLHHALLAQGEEIRRYNIITPTAWNFSPHDDRGNPGPVEECLIGTVLADPDHPVEVGRIVRAFDPCMSCATHVVRPGRGAITIAVGRPSGAADRRTRLEMGV